VGSTSRAWVMSIDAPSTSACLHMLRRWEQCRTAATDGGVESLCGFRRGVEGVWKLEYGMAGCLMLTAGEEREELCRNWRRGLAGSPSPRHAAVAVAVMEGRDKDREHIVARPPAALLATRPCCLKPLERITIHHFDLTPSAVRVLLRLEQLAGESSFGSCQVRVQGNCRCNRAAPHALGNHALAPFWPSRQNVGPASHPSKLCRSRCSCLLTFTARNQSSQCPAFQLGAGCSGDCRQFLARPNEAPV
jgi:hypothetical protein